ncbi:MAG: sensor histidine kinase [Candidatus Dormibacteraeota bacterium]|nr:sensor histidine kinase [Candidatus Dormibacteraeota bacterium]
MTDRRARVLGTAFALSWLGILGVFLADMLSARPHIQHRQQVLPGLAVFVLIYGWFWVWGMYSRRLLPRLVGVALLALVTIAIVRAGGEAIGSIFIFLAVVAGAAFMWRISTALVLLIGLLVLFGDFNSIHQPVLAAAVALQTTLIGLASVGAAALGRTVLALRQARNELARLAVSEERLRFARDLHDLLGHSLSVVVLKSELARQVMERDPRRAADELAEIERVARDALRDVREAVAGYRQTNLATELSGAREMLESAGIACRLQEDAGLLSPAAETALAWAVREGATNVLRHSRARECVLRLTREDGTAMLEMVDDGTGPGAASAPAGNGLRGLGERVAAVGGEFHAGPADGRGFRLLVTVPA